MGCHVILQGIFLTQGSNPCLLPLFFPCLIIYSEELCKNTWSLSFSQLYSIPLGKLYYNLFSLFPLARLWVFSVFCYNVTATVKICTYLRTSLVVQQLRLYAPSAGGMDSIPAQVISCATWYGVAKKKESYAYVISYTCRSIYRMNFQKWEF